MRSSYIKYIIALLLFGSNGIVASHITMSSYEIVLSRTVIGGAFLLILLFWRKEKLPGWKNKKQLAYLLISGLALGANWLFLYEAYQQIGVSLATLACYCGPVLVILLSSVVFHERITVLKIAGLVAVMAGMVCVNGADVKAQGLSWGLLCGLLSAVMYAVLVISVKKTKGLSGLASAASQLVIGGIMVAIFTAAVHGEALSLSMESIVAIVILGVINTGIGCYLYFSGVQELPAQSVSICGYIEPLSALIFAALFLQEALSSLQITGAVLILGGVAVAEVLNGWRSS